MHPPDRPNRLAAESSPYLRQHATNPVDWYPWGDEALRRARDEQRPILLSIGYSACHWCHVMAHESFEDPGTAQLMNAQFVNVKVDREERPDLDQVYQGVVQLMGGQGGWPLTVFLTPDLVPFYGGTYFPPEPRHGLPSFGMLLDALSQAWTEKRDEVLSQAGEFKNGLRQLATYGLGTLVTPVSGDDVAAAGRALARALDPVEGGFGGAPKFPNTMGLALLLRAWRRTGNAALRDGALHSLDRMVTGGIHDQLGGGFHRYSVDRFWRVPHFEKMLYDNALLLHLLAEAQQNLGAREVGGGRVGAGGVAGAGDDGPGRRVPRHPGRRQRGGGGEVLRLEPGRARGGARARGRHAGRVRSGGDDAGNLRARA